MEGHLWPGSEALSAQPMISRKADEQEATRRLEETRDMMRQELGRMTEALSFLQPPMRLC